MLAIVAFCLIYFWYLSLPRTLLAVNTAVYQSSCIFVYMFSLMLLKDEHHDWRKVASMVACATGVVLVSFFSYQDSSEEACETATCSRHDLPCVSSEATAVGYVFLFLSTLLYALYEVLYRRMVPNLPPNSSSMRVTAESFFLLGIMGCFTGTHPPLAAMLLSVSLILSVAFLLWPGILILDATGVEPIVWPSDSTTWFYIISLGLLECVYNALMMLAILASSPLFVSIGTTLALPTAVVLDLLLRDSSLPPGAYASMPLIIAGFVGMTWLDAIEPAYRTGNEWYTWLPWKRSPAHQFHTIQ